MNQPAKPSSSRIVVVCVGMAALFAGTWFIVKKGSARSESDASPALVETKITAIEGETAPNPSPEAPVTPVPSQTPPVPTAETMSTAASPEVISQAPPVPAPAPAPEVASTAPAPAMLEPLTPLEPVMPPAPPPVAPPQTAEASPPAEMASPPAPESPPATDEKAKDAAPAPMVASVPAETKDETAPMTPPTEAEKKEGNDEKPQSPEADAKPSADPAVVAKVDGKQMPPAGEEAPVKEEDKGKDKDKEKTAESGKEVAKTDEKAAMTEKAEGDAKDKPEEKASTKEDPKAADKGKDDKKEDKGKETESKVAENKDGKPDVKDATDSKASDHDMEGPPEDGEVADAKDAKKPEAPPESTKNIKPTSSNEMPGWELLHYQARDYITAHSIHKFYRFANLSVEGNNVWFRSPVLIMKATVGSQDLLINNIKFVMSYPVVVLNDKPCFSRLDLCKLIDPVLRPSYIGSAAPFDTVILDPGHGGHDSGAKGIYGYEKDFALKLAFAVKASLERKGLKVVMTRSTDTFLSLGARVAIANKVPNSIYVSLHFNSGGSAATGIETFALSPQGSASVYGARETDYVAFSGNQRDSENIALATAIHAGVVHHFKLVDRGVKRARWHVLKGLQRPGVLFEGGFVTNANDGRLIAAENFRTELAATIAQSIINYRRALQPKSR